MRHTFVAGALSEGANLKGLAEYCGTSAQMIEESYGRCIRKDFLGPLVAGCPKTLGKATVGEKPDPPLGVLGKRLEFPGEFWWRPGGLNRPRKSDSLTGKCLILEQNQGLSVICRKIFAGPKRPKKTPTIPKNRTGSGSARKKPQERRSGELDAAL